MADPINFESQPILTTKRLVLRDLLRSDLHSLLSLRSDPVVNKFLARKKDPDEWDILDFLNRIENSNREKLSLYWAICPSDSDELIGTACVWDYHSSSGCAEIGYELAAGYHGQGLMSEALASILEFLRTVPNLNKLIGCTEALNLSSRKLLENYGFHIARTELEKAEHGGTDVELVIYEMTL